MSHCDANLTKVYANSAILSVLFHRFHDSQENWYYDFLTKCHQQTFVIPSDIEMLQLISSILEKLIDLFQG